MPLSAAGHLEKLQLHGNQLSELPQSIRGLTSLKSLSLQGNALQSLPGGVTCLQVSVLSCTFPAVCLCSHVSQTSRLSLLLSGLGSIGSLPGCVSMPREDHLAWHAVP